MADVLSPAHMVCSQTKRSKVDVHSLFAALCVQEIILEMTRGCACVCVCVYQANASCHSPTTLCIHMFEVLNVMWAEIRKKK